MACRAGGVPADAVEMREAVIEIEARAGMDAPYPFLAALVPADWTIDGAVALDGADNCGVYEKPRLRAVSADGAASLEIVPGAGWTASPYKAQFSGCKSRNLHDAARYAEELLKSAESKAAITGSAERADLTDQFKSYVDYVNASGARADASAAELTFEVRSPGAAPMHGVIIAAMLTNTPHIHIPEHEKRATAYPAVIARTRGAAPDPKLVEAFRASATVNPGWMSVRERLLGWSGRGSADGDLRTLIRNAAPFPARASGAAAKACGGSFASLDLANLWKAEDGRIWFSPSLTGALAGPP